MELVKIAGPLILAFIMLSLGLGLKIENYKRVLIQPKDFLIGFISQVIFFPLVALVLALIFPLPLELKVGLLLLAIAPGGVTTNIISKYANGDVALSISLTAVISLLCFITIPVVFSITYPFLTGSDLPFNYSIGSIIIQIFLITTVPVIIGMILKAIFPNFFSKTEKIFVNKLSGISPTRKEALMYKSSILYDLCCLYAKKGWTQQFHLGAIRNNNYNLFNTVGPDVGCDSIGDFSQAQKMSSFFNKLNSYGLLTNTIVYNLNPSMNEVFASMIGNFSSSNISMHHGSAWWYLDQKAGIEKQINSLSSVGVISKFIGMVTDSRSFLSFPRHEYFRRIISNIFGNDIKKGLIPNDLDFYGKIIQDICFNNAEKSLKL